MQECGLHEFANNIGIRVILYHSEHRLEKYTFSVSTLARYSACKIKEFRP